MAIDTETGGAHGQPLIAIALVAATSRSIVTCYASTVRPTRDTRIRFQALHGIGPQDLASAPYPTEVFDDIRGLLELAPLIVAHNAAFDRRVLRLAFGSALPRLRFRCTMRLARERWPGSAATLSAVCARLGLRNDSPHDPVSDATAAAEIYRRIRIL